MIVPDASVVLDVLLRAPDCERIERRVFAPGETLHAPQLLDVEVAQVLRRYVLRREITAEHGARALELFARFPIHRYPHTPLLARIWALRENVTAYDAAYVALAEGLGAVMLTQDIRLVAAVGDRSLVTDRV